MLTAHESLIELGIKLGYFQKPGGLCHGTTLRFLEAYLLDEQDTFISRINKIASIKNLDVLIHQTQEKVKKHESLTTDDSMHLEILAFYDSLMLYHSPQNHLKKTRAAILGLLFLKTTAEPGFYSPNCLLKNSS